MARSEPAPLSYVVAIDPGGPIQLLDGARTVRADGNRLALRVTPALTQQLHAMARPTGWTVLRTEDGVFKLYNGSKCLGTPDLHPQPLKSLLAGMRIHLERTAGAWLLGTIRATPAGVITETGLHPATAPALADEPGSPHTPAGQAEDGTLWLRSSRGELWAPGAPRPLADFIERGARAVLIERDGAWHQLALE